MNNDYNSLLFRKDGAQYSTTGTCPYLMLSHNMFNGNKPYDIKKNMYV